MQRTERRQSAQCLRRLSRRGETKLSTLQRPSASLAEAGAVAEVRAEDEHAWADKKRKETYRTVTQQFSTQLCIRLYPVP